MAARIGPAASGAKMPSVRTRFPADTRLMPGGHGVTTLLLSVLGAFAEFERALIRERQAEGIALARARGAYRGRKPP